jgi:hypothetical protein
VSHTFWLTAPKATIKITDKAWNYCDEKCLNLETLTNKTTDFVVVHFKDKIFKPNFAACYVKNNDGTYSLWNTKVHNVFYEKLCGGDKDWLEFGKYEITNVLGIGIGTPLEY